MVRLWLDDVREPPEDYNVHVETVEDAIYFLETYEVEHVGFDHDLGYEKTGYDLAKWIEYQATQGLPRLTWSIQSANPVGAKNIEAAMKMAERYWRAGEEVCRNYAHYPDILKHFGDMSKTLKWFTHRDAALGELTPLQMILVEQFKELDKFIAENFIEDKKV